MTEPPDEIQRLVSQWGQERPDLDLDTMATAARLLRVGGLLGQKVGALAADYGVQPADADIIFTLRRAGPPYRLTPSRLSESLLVSSGTLTSRLDRLERRGLISRTSHPTDRRSLEVALTDEGYRVADEAVTRHVANEQRLLGVLSKRERDGLNAATRKLLRHLSEDQGEKP